jgi:hypothetical protein
VRIVLLQPPGVHFHDGSRSLGSLSHHARPSARLRPVVP